MLHAIENTHARGRASRLVIHSKKGFRQAVDVVEVGSWTGWPIPRGEREGMAGMQFDKHIWENRNVDPILKL